MSGFVHQRLRNAADHAARISGWLARRERESDGALTVLMYHRVLPDERCADYPLPSLAMPLGAFREQVHWLTASGEVLPLARALERASRPDRPARRLFSITIDDGYDDAARFAAEVLEECGVRATFFVTTDFVRTGELLWFDKAVLLFERTPEATRRAILRELGVVRPEPVSRSAESSAWVKFLKRCPPGDRRSILATLEDAAGGAPAVEGFQPMSIEQVAALHAKGHEIGSHSVTHPLMPELDDVTLRRETRDAHDALSSWLGSEVPGFCYPNGDCDERVAAAVANAGHSYACTTRDGLHRTSDDPFRIRRVDVVPARVLDRGGRFDVTAFRRELCGLYRQRPPVPEGAP